MPVQSNARERRIRTKIKLTSWLWPGFVVVTSLLAVFFPYRGWSFLFIAMGSVLGVGYLWISELRRHLRLTREIRYGWAQVGDLLEERFTLINSGGVPGLWVEITDGSTIPGYRVNRATGVELHGENSWLIHQACTRRGLYTLGPTKVRTGDPFGVFTLTILHEDSASLLVTPAILPLPTIQVAAGGRAGEGRPSRRSLEPTTISSSVRQYSPGDSYQRMHWPTTAHREEYFVKTFDHTPEGDWWIITDIDQAVQVGVGEKSTEESAIIVAASLADRGLRKGIPVGLIAGSKDLVWIPPRIGDAQRWLILESLARLSPGHDPLADLLNRVASGARHQSSLIIITANTRGDWLPALLQLMVKGAVPTILLLDPISFGGFESSRSLSLALEQQAITHYMVNPELFNQRSSQVQSENAWEWRTSPTGKAIPIHQPSDMSWRELR